MECILNFSELKKIQLLKPEETPFINDLEILIENRIKNQKGLSKDQRELIITSLKNAKKMLIKLKERKPESKEKKIDSGTF